MKTISLGGAWRAAFFGGLLALIGAPEALDAAGAAPPPAICDRPCWNARGPTSIPPEMSALNRAVIHHTAGSGDYNVSSINDSKAKVRAIQNLHMDVNKWSDIGYHFLVDKLGNTFEGRYRSIFKAYRPKGAHDSNNVNSFGYNVLGYYHPPYNQFYTQSARNAIYDVIAWRMPDGWDPYGAGSYNGRTVGYVAGHRDVKATGCPGDGVYADIGTNFWGGPTRDGINARIQGAPPPPPPPPEPLKNQVHIVVRGGDGAAWIRSWWASGGWQSWYSLGGNISGGPDAYSINPEHLCVTVHSATQPGHIKKKTWTLSGGWDDFWVDMWTSAGGNMTSDPGSNARGEGAAHIVARGPDNALWRRSWDVNTGWADWATLAGNIAGAPDSCSRSWDHLFVAAASATDPGHIKHRSWSASGGWGGWFDLWTSAGGNMSSAPSAVARGSDKVHVLARKGGEIWIRTHTKGVGWAEWYSLGKPGGNNAVDDPDAYSRGSTHLGAVARDEFGNIWKRTWTSDGGWAAWENIGQPAVGATSSPGAVAR